MSTDNNTIAVEYKIIPPQMMTIEMVRSQYGPGSFAYTKKKDETYEVVAISGLDAPNLRSKLLIDNVPFRGVEETEFKIVSEVV